MAPLLWSCCGGERFVLLPGIGYTHLPLQLMAFQDSFTLPILTVLVLFIALLLACVPLRLLRHKRGLRWALSLVVAGASIPWILTGPVGKNLAEYFSNRKSYDQYIAGNLSVVLYNSRIEKRPPPQLGAWLHPEQADLVVKRVWENKEHWHINLALGKGTPHFGLGIKYGGIYRGGKYAMGTKSEMSEATNFMWSEFHGVYESFRSAVEEEMGAKARLNRWMWPPSFLMNFPHAVYTHQLDVHTDRWLREIKFVNETYPEERPHSVCEWTRQLTVVVALEEPTGGMGFDWWSYGHADGTGDGGIDCKPVGKPKPECVTFHSKPYSLGGLFLFDSSVQHSGSKEPIDVSKPLEARMFLNAFLVPCREKAERVWEIFGVRGR